MKCLKCNSETVREIKTVDYNISGLQNIFLEDIEHQVCSDCGFEAQFIPCISVLHRNLVQSIITYNALLSSREIKFLRKSLGYSVKELAKYLNVSGADVFKWESGEDAISLEADRLLRFFVAIGGSVTSFIPCLKTFNYTESVTKTISAYFHLDTWYVMVKPDNPI